MALSDLTDPDAVRRALKDFDAQGRDAFLAVHGFRRATKYFVVADGNRYDSKAIAAVAHLYQHGAALRASEFSGGESTVAKRLQQLGFEVSSVEKLPNWSVDELMLALDLYLRTRGRMSYSATSNVAVELSRTLRSLGIFPDVVRADPRFRNPSGVALKLHNFTSIDPERAGHGMGHGGAGDRRTWDEWAHRPDDLARAVALIRHRGAAEQAPPDTGEDEEYEAPEGRILFREHRRYERDRTLVERKKASALKATGRLACEVCGFDSHEVYGVRGVIDIHHVVPLHEIGESTTSLSDLALVCPTCHRVLHKHRPIITPAELRAARQA